VITKSDKEILVEARNLIADPSKWIRGNLALDAEGKRLSDGFDPNACKWCALGAVDKVVGDLAGEGYYRRFRNVQQKLNYIAVGLGYSYAADLNDESDHDTVIKMFDIAIKESE
jgi:hypothetical protein